MSKHTHIPRRLCYYSYFTTESGLTSIHVCLFTMFSVFISSVASFHPSYIFASAYTHTHYDGAGLSSNYYFNEMNFQTLHCIMGSLANNTFKCEIKPFSTPFSSTGNFGLCRANFASMGNIRNNIKLVYIVR